MVVRRLERLLLNLSHIQHLAYSTEVQRSQISILAMYNMSYIFRLDYIKVYFDQVPVGTFWWFFTKFKKVWSVVVVYLNKQNRCYLVLQDTQNIKWIIFMYANIPWVKVNIAFDILFSYFRHRGLLGRELCLACPFIALRHTSLSGTGWCLYAPYVLKTRRDSSKASRAPHHPQTSETTI